MKLTNDDMRGKLERPALLLRHYGRLYEVTAVLTSMDEANDYMRAHPGESLLAEHGAFCFIVQHADEGDITLTVRMVALIEAIRAATPGELTQVAKALREYAASPATCMHDRDVARDLAAMLHGVR